MFLDRLLKGVLRSGCLSMAPECFSNVVPVMGSWCVPVRLLLLFVGTASRSVTGNKT